jgi:hypothetical protein
MKAANKVVNALALASYYGLDLMYILTDPEAKAAVKTLLYAIAKNTKNDNVRIEATEAIFLMESEE